MAFVGDEGRNLFIPCQVEIQLDATPFRKSLTTRKPKPVDIGTPLPDDGTLWSTFIDQLKQATLLERGDADAVGEAQQRSLTVPIRSYKDVLRHLG